MILGLDISTSLTGFTVLNVDGSLLHNEVIDLRSTKFESMFDKASAVKDRFIQIKDLYDIRDIYIEQSLNAFRPGLSSAQVILTLGKFNGIVSWICYEIWKMEPKYIGASSARKSIGIKVEKGQNAKEIVLKHILDTEKTFMVEYTPKGNPKAGTFDRADSLVIAKAGYLQCQKQRN